MPEPFKNLFNPQMIALMGYHFKRVWDKFDEPGFVKMAIFELDKLELKQRSDQIVQAMEKHLPTKFTDAAPILINSLHPDDIVDLSGTEMDAQGIRGWGTMSMTQYVGKHGLEDFDLGMSVQKEITKRGSSEFGIRPFIALDEERALMTLSQWASDDNDHVRRLVSEGSRPRLPWAMQLTNLVRNPKPLIPILAGLLVASVVLLVVAAVVLELAVPVEVGQVENLLHRTHYKDHQIGFAYQWLPHLCVVFLMLFVLEYLRA